MFRRKILRYILSKYLQVTIRKRVNTFLTIFRVRMRRSIQPGLYAPAPDLLPSGIGKIALQALSPIIKPKYNALQLPEHF